jgi:AGCS family alanine or glycine:cation symporter
MALLALTNLAAMWKLYPLGLRLLSDFEAQRKQGQTPVFVMSQMPEQDLDPESWGEPADLEQTG